MYLVLITLSTGHKLPIEIKQATDSSMAIIKALETLNRHQSEGIKNVEIIELAKDIQVV